MSAAVAAPIIVAVAACHRPGDRIVVPDAGSAATAPTTRVLEMRSSGSLILYAGVTHADAAVVRTLWDSFGPTIAVIEGEPAVEATPEIAAGKHGPGGVARWLAARDGATVRRLDPSPHQEAAGVSRTIAPADLKTFLVLREVAADAARAPEFRAGQPEGAAQRALDALATEIPGRPRTLAEFEQEFRRLAPEIADWRTVSLAMLEPGAAAAPGGVRRVARARAAFRHLAMVDALESLRGEPARIFALTDPAAVAVQEPELRARFDDVRERASVASVASAGPPVVRSLRGDALAPPELTETRRIELARKLVEYTERCAAPAPAEDDFIWLGRTLGYMHRYHDAIDAFTRGLERYPGSHRLLRHRGHRFITIRDFGRALQDLRRAAAIVDERQLADEVEPDGMPNRSGIPRSTTNTNILYHLGLAHFLRREYHDAALAFERCLRISPNDDMTVATVHWLWVSKGRSGDAAGGANVLEKITPTMQILENTAYHKLCRLYRGELTPEQVLPSDTAGVPDPLELASTGFGVANWLRVNGREAEGAALLEKVAASPMWPAFGVIAAEADLVDRGSPDK